MDAGPSGILEKQECSIVMEARGDAAAPELGILRDFRDEILFRYWLGRVFIRLYYAVSPGIARVLARSSALCHFVRALLVRPLAWTAIWTRRN